MKNPTIEALNKKRELLNNEYRTVAIEYTTVKNDYIEKLQGLGAQIHEIDVEMRGLRMPREE